MKNNKLLFAFSIFLILMLSGCTHGQPNGESATETFSSTETSAPYETKKTPSVDKQDVEPPLNEQELNAVAPKFLTTDQQLLYRRACSLYRHMWNGETSAIDDYPLQLSTQDTQIYNTVELEGKTYLISHGRYSKWADFESVVSSVFTDACFHEYNTIEESPIFRAYKDNLSFMDLSRDGNINYNNNFPDEFELIAMTDDLIQFNVIGHFSEEYPVGDETSEERNKRLKSDYEYTLSTSIKLINEDGIWKFSQFGLASDAEFRSSR